jgi:hypothetical protein
MSSLKPYNVTDKPYNIIDLPIELTVRVANRLDVGSLVAMSCTCKALNAAASDPETVHEHMYTLMNGFPPESSIPRLNLTSWRLRFIQLGAAMRPNELEDVQNVITSVGLSAQKNEPWVIRWIIKDLPIPDDSLYMMGIAAAVRSGAQTCLHYLVLNLPRKCIEPSEAAIAMTDILDAMRDSERDQVLGLMQQNPDPTRRLLAERYRAMGGAALKLFMRRCLGQEPWPALLNNVAAPNQVANVPPQVAVETRCQRLTGWLGDWVRWAATPIRNRLFRVVTPTIAPLQ